MFWAFKVLIMLAISYGTSKLAQLRKPEDETRPAPAGQDDIQAPTVEEGRAIPVIWGTVYLKSPNVVWYGDLQAVWNQTWLTWTYFLSVQYGWCHGEIDAVQGFFWDDIEVTPREYTGPPGMFGDPITLPLVQPTQSVWIEEGDLFGGIEGEGGLQGRYIFNWGTEDQQREYYLAIQLGVDPDEMPPYRGICYSLALSDGPSYHFYQGTSPYVKPHGLVLSRWPNQLGLGDDKHKIGDDLNPAVMLYEVLRDEIWGLGIPAAMIDTDSFSLAGETLYAESFGLSFQQTAQTDGEQIVHEILRHIDGVLVPHETTGLLTLRLIRDDYDLEELLEIDDDAIVELEDFFRPGPDGLANKIMLKYIDSAQNYDEKIAQAVDLAGVQALGGVVAQDVSFFGISKAELAQTIAARELKAAAYPFAAIRLTVTRKAHALRPGDPFLFSRAALGISGMVCRVVSVGFGPITDGLIRLEAVEDAFGINWTAYTPPATSGWAPFE